MGGPLERLAAVEGVAVLEQLDVVLAHLPHEAAGGGGNGGEGWGAVGVGARVGRHLIDELAGDVHLPERQLEVVAVVQHLCHRRKGGGELRFAEMS